MNIKISKNAGFCFGVKRAMKMAWNEVVSGEDDIYALGPLIHNKQAVAKYEEKGLKTVAEVSDVPYNKNMIIRSHGVAEKVYKDSLKKDINIIDTTCPFVKKIHDIANEYYINGYKIIVIGDAKHPEVIGINGWCNDSAIVINNMEEFNNIKLDNSLRYCVVAQTTINSVLYNEIKDALKANLNDVVFNDTICSATKTRQQAARDLSKEVECMIVIGGKHSSNTQKLVKVCEEYVPTFAIETKDEIDKDEILKYSEVGITAGASTPDWIIEDVIDYLKSL